MKPRYEEWDETVIGRKKWKGYEKKEMKRFLGRKRWNGYVKKKIKWFIA